MPKSLQLIGPELFTQLRSVRAPGRVLERMDLEFLLLPNSSSILRLKAGTSSGFLLEMSPSSTTTSRSTQCAPAFSRSVLSDGHDVRVRPLTTSASISVHGPWQIAATGLPDSKKARTNATAFGKVRS